MIDIPIQILKIWAVGAVITMLLLSMLAAIAYKWEKYIPLSLSLPKDYPIKKVIMEMSLLWPVALALIIAMAMNRRNDKE